MLNGVQVDPVTWLINGLHQRFGALDEETRMRAMQEMLTFRRRPGERINDLLTRFDMVRQRGQAEGRLLISVEGYAQILLNACGVNDAQLMQLLAPLQGRLPTDDLQFTQMTHYLRRMGHILEHSPGNIAASSHRHDSHPRGPHQQTFMASEPAAATAGHDANNWLGAQSDDAGGAAASTGGFWPPTEETTPSGTDDVQHAFQATIDDDDGTDTDTASDTGSAMAADDVPGETDAAKFERYF